MPEVEIVNNKVKESYGGDLMEGKFEDKFDSIRKVEGYLHDELVNSITGERRVVHDWEKNLIVIGFSNLASALFKINGYTGLQYWAVGQGEYIGGNPQNSLWDSMTIEERAAKSYTSMTQLYSEAYRRAVTMSFLDTSNNPTLTVTNRLEVRATFGVDVTNVYMREFGVFGGNATEGVNTGLMIDHKTHAVVAFNIGTAEMILYRTLRLVL